MFCKRSDTEYLPHVSTIITPKGSGECERTTLWWNLNCFHQDLRNRLQRPGVGLHKETYDISLESSCPVALSPRPMTLALTWRERSRGTASLSKRVSRYFQHTLHLQTMSSEMTDRNMAPPRFHLLQRWDTRELRTQSPDQLIRF